MRYTALLGIVVSTILIGCETFRVTDIRDNHRLPPTVAKKEVVQEKHDLNEEGFFEQLRKACRDSGSFSLVWKGKTERYHCYPVED